MSCPLPISFRPYLPYHPPMSCFHPCFSLVACPQFVSYPLPLPCLSTVSCPARRIGQACHSWIRASSISEQSLTVWTVSKEPLQDVQNKLYLIKITRVSRPARDISALVVEQLYIPHSPILNYSQLSHGPQCCEVFAKSRQVHHTNLHCSSLIYERYWLPMATLPILVYSHKMQAGSAMSWFHWRCTWSISGPGGVIFSQIGLIRAHGCPNWCL